MKATVRILLALAVTAVALTFTACDDGYVEVDYGYDYDPTCDTADDCTDTAPLRHDYVLDVFVMDAWGWPLRGATIDLTVADVPEIAAGALSARDGTASFAIRARPGTFISVLVVADGYAPGYIELFTDASHFNLALDFTLTARKSLAQRRDPAPAAPSADGEDPSPLDP